jgi:hypothetical protein
MSAWSEGEGKTGRALIINEAHGLRTDAIECFLTALEDIPAHACVIFTTTKAGQERLFEDSIDAHPLMSRCVPLELSTEGIEAAFPAYAKAIAEKEGLDGRPYADYVALCQRERYNLRAVFQAIETGVMLDASESLSPPATAPALQLSAAKKATLTRWGLGNMLDRTA